MRESVGTTGSIDDAAERSISRCSRVLKLQRISHIPEIVIDRLWRDVTCSGSLLLSPAVQLAGARPTPKLAGAPFIRTKHGGPVKARLSPNAVRRPPCPVLSSFVTPARRAGPEHSPVRRGGEDQQ